MTEYATGTIAPGRVLSSARPVVSDTKWADIQAIYPIGAVSADRFSHARWFLDPDGTAFVSLPSTAGPRVEGSLAGSWKRADDGTLHLHTSERGERGLVMALDGLLVPDQGEARLKAIYTVEVQGARHVEWIDARLTAVGNQSDPEEIARRLDRARFQRKFEGRNQNLGRPLSEPTEFLGGVPVPTDYDVTFTGQVDGQPFGPLPGVLLLRSTQRSGTATPDLLLGTPGGAVVPGWNKWTSSRETPHTTASEKAPPSAEPGVTVQVAEGHLVMTIAPAPAPRELLWWTRNPEQPGENTFVLVDTGTLDLQIGKDRVTGTLTARGHLAIYGAPESRLSAQISGSLQAAGLIETLTKSVGTRRFAGRWQDPRLGAMDLRQQDQAVTGVLDGGGTLVGEADGPLLALHLQSAPGGVDQGFLRAGQDGSLIGLAWNTADALGTAQPLVAVQQGLDGKPTDNVDRFPAPTTDAEADAMKRLGYDYDEAGKHRDAAEALAKALDYYAQRANAAKDQSEQEKYLLAQGVAVNTLIESAFEAGDYQRLVNGLGKALDLQASLGQDRAGARMFAEQAGRYEQSLRKSAHSLGLLAAAFERSRGGLNTGGIGVGIETAPDGRALIINAVLPKMPAGQAGIAAGDRLLTINGTPTPGLTVEEASNRLRGTAGTQVSVVVTGAGKEREMQLTRAILNRVSPERLPGLSQALTGLRDLTASTQQQLSAAADRVAAAADQPGLPAAFDQLATDVADRRTALEKTHDQAVTLARQALGGRPEALDLLERFVALMSAKSQAPQDAAVNEPLMELDRNVDEFEHTNGPDDLDTRLLNLNILMISELDVLQVQLAWRTKLLEQRQRMAKEAPLPDAMQKTLDSLSQRLDMWRARLATDQGKMEALEGSQAFYEDYIKLVKRLQLPAAALAVSESARARAFLDLLAAQPTTAKTAANQSAVLPNVTKGSAATIRTPNLDAILALVRDTRATVLEYFILDDALLAWVIDPGADGNQAQPTVHLRTIAVTRKDLNLRIERLQHLMLDLTPKEELAAGPEISAALRDLYGVLIEPLADLLPSQPERPLTIVPHRGLFALPFAALARTDESGHDRYLIQDHALVYAPSLGVMKQVQDRARGKERGGAPKLLAVVNPQFPLERQDKTGASLAQLPQMETEMGRILGFYAPQQVQVLKGRDATPEQVLAAAPSQDVVLFATHAVAAPNPADSYIALAGRPLRIEDLTKGRLNARLVILAACETGAGRISSDGVEGLGRAAIGTGADALIATLWKVPEDATMEFLYGFHRAWRREGKGMVQAVREAQVRLLSNHRDQIRLWAGFAIIGGDE